MAQSFRQLIGAQPSTASPSDSTLVIIDAQGEYADGALHVSNIASSRKAIANLLQKYRDANGKVVHVQHIVPDGTPIFTPDTPLGDILPELKPQGSEAVIKKNHPSAFADTKLEETLEAKSKIVLTGYMAHVCVSTTARDAARLGYDVVIPLDCIGDRDIPGAKGDEVVDMVAKELGDAFGTIVQSKDIK
ncbi:unnamed protein product [Zymoseptoria tritici ST99CH_1A5]|uniref:Isochorismatase family hydrolase like protein n=3 Tax=Zymoseptoria TaxID=1047167 RepID=A0A0F4GA92_9PEZI|nr:uncharacterized protein MYCGRDRAFT_103912 [Zymoseptoria tritici IPO323]EGP89209.1 hypothetical protein MYCGRDRAFT_103912 [Zymoseptoria tritici IPO323]KJX93125.1 isochorismatase family hydrolase like protein [Zymoseptoria brevis]SMR50276.1 unnamed protein product [Zymoseptoria tritici ST99CH_3D1]SMY22969.1 unnamed protein product [Zymoseptoria tritici ST99CH_1A5]